MTTARLMKVCATAIPGRGANKGGMLIVRVALNRPFTSIVFALLSLIAAARGIDLYV
jgi:hypothetical protein